MNVSFQIDQILSQFGGTIMKNAVWIAVLAIGCQTQVQQDEIELPQLYISAQDIDFGEVVWGDTVYRTVYIENQGALSMGLHAISLETEGFEQNFTLGYFTETITCADTEDAEANASTDTGSPANSSARRNLTVSLKRLLHKIRRNGCLVTTMAAVA